MIHALTLVTRGVERRLVFEELAGHAAAIDLGSISTRQGRAVRLADLLADSDAIGTTLTLASSADGYSATLPLQEASAAGFIWFAGIDGPLMKEQGGPFRFLIPNAAECKTAVLDNCANVKHVDRIEVE